MTKLNLKSRRPKSKKETLQERRNLVITKNHLDLEEERRERKELFLDDGRETSDDDDEAPPNEVPWKQLLNSQQKEPERGDDDEEKDKDSKPSETELSLNGNDLNDLAGLLDESGSDTEGNKNGIDEKDSNAEFEAGAFSDAKGDTGALGETEPDVEGETAVFDEEESNAEDEAGASGDAESEVDAFDEEDLDAECETGFFGEGESDDASVADSSVFSQTRKRKIVFSDAVADGDLNDHVNIEDSGSKIVVLNATNSSKLIKPKTNFRDELLRSTTDYQRMKDFESKAHVEKWRRVY